MRIYYKAIFTIILLVAGFGIIVPSMVSAKSDTAVWIGLLLSAITLPLYLLFWK